MKLLSPKPTRRPSAGASGAVRRAFGPDLVRAMDELCARGRSEGPVDLMRDYAAAAAAAAVGTAAGGVVVPAVCVVYVGVRQRHLSNLTHECIHLKFTRSSRANRLFGHLLTVTLGEPFTPYKRSHRVHHAQLGSPADPMLQSYLRRDANSPWPDKTAFVVHVIVKNAVWELPRSGLVTLATKSGEETWTAAGTRWALWAGAALAAASAGHLRTFLLYWAFPLVVVRPIITWLTDLGNHAGLIENDDVITQTRGWTSHWLTRHLLGGHNDDQYHPVHHFFPGIGWRQLPDAEQILRREFPRWGQVPWCSGYFFRRRSTPHIPSVLDDIVARLNSRPTPGAPALSLNRVASARFSNLDKEAHA